MAPTSLRNLTDRLLNRLFEPVDAASLAFFRIYVGVILLWDVWKFYANNWIDVFFMMPRFHFTFYGFGWVTPWDGEGMYWHFFVLGLSAFCITIGLWYRVAAVVYFVGATHVFLLEQARYINHYYLICLLAFFFIFLPANRLWSVDEIRKPRLHSDSVPAWSVWLLRFQLGIVYFYAGIAKIHPDWLRGEPMRTMLEQGRDRLLFFGSLAGEPWFVLFMSWSGMLFDLLIVPLLLWKRTRLFAYLVAVSFHLMNTRIFTNIGIFPWMMIGATTIYFAPDWPRRWVHWWNTRGTRRAKQRYERPQNDTKAPPLIDWKRHAFAAFLVIYAAIQLLVPFRHWLYPGDVTWTEEGHRFSWRMKLYIKAAYATFHVTDRNTGREFEVRPRDQVSPNTGLPLWQERPMRVHPDMLLQYAHHLARELRRQGLDPEVRAEVLVSVNGREAQPFIDPTVDLASIERSLAHSDWILPYDASKPIGVLFQENAETAE